MARKMKDSGIEWIGEIPEGWEIRKIKNNFMIYAGATPKSEKAEYWDGGIPWITPADFKTTDKYVSYGRKSLTALGYDSCGTTLVPAGSIIFSKRAPVGSVVIAKNTLCTNQGCLACIPNDAVNSTYFYYCMSIFTEQFELVSAGTTFKEIAASTFASFLLPCPPLSQQNEIVNFLNKESSRIDSMLSKTRSSIEEYKKLKQAVITQSVTKGVRGEREMKDSGIDYIGQIPAKWVLGKLRNVGDTQNGISKSSEFFGKGFPFVSYSDVYKNYSLPFAVSGLVESTPEEQERYSVKEGDIFFTRTSETIEEVGFSCVCEKDIPNATFAGFLIRVRPFSDKLHTPYAKYYFRSTHLRFYLVKEMNLVTRASLGQSLLKSMPVLLPPLEEQKEIADYLDAKCAEIDKLIAKKEQLVKELESYKKSLIYEVVTGKREV